MRAMIRVGGERWVLSRASPQRDDRSGYPGEVFPASDVLELSFCATSFWLWPLCGRLAVTLIVMSDTKHVVLIHGTWCRGDSWTPTRAAFEERGYTVHTPTLRHHELPLQ